MHRDLTIDQVDLCKEIGFSYKCSKCGAYTENGELEDNSGFCGKCSDIIFSVGCAGVATFLVDSFKGKKYRLFFKMPRTRENYDTYNFFFE